jgi:hypothetical protein
MVWVEDIAAASAILSIVCFLLYVVDLLRLPTDRRPAITPLDRLGHPLPPAENPDYRDTEEERGE